MQESLLRMIMAFVGALGFCMIFNLRRRLWLPAALGGLLSWEVYLLSHAVTGELFLATMAAAAFAALYAEILARWLKAPATLFLIPALVPMIPGSTLYYAMSAAVRQDWILARDFGAQTAQYALGIAIGISLVWALWEMARNLRAGFGRRV